MNPICKLARPKNVGHISPTDTMAALCGINVTHYHFQRNTESIYFQQTLLWTSLNYRILGNLHALCSL